MTSLNVGLSPQETTHLYMNPLDAQVLLAQGASRRLQILS